MYDILLIWRAIIKVRNSMLPGCKRHSFSLSIPHRHSQTHFQHRCLVHTSFSMHGDRRVSSVPRFQPGIDPFIGHPWRNGNMPVYRASSICLPIHRDTTTSMALGPSAKSPHPFFFGKAKRRNSSRSQSKGKRYLIYWCYGIWSTHFNIIRSDHFIKNFIWQQVTASRLPSI